MASSTEHARLALTMPRLSRYGGAESFAWRLAEVLAARGHEVDFICARCETEPPAGVNPVVVGRFGGLRLVKTLWFAWRADRLTGEGGYDLVFGMGNTVNQDILRIGGGSISKFWQLSKRAWPAGFPRWFKMLRRRLAPANWVIHLLDAARMRRTPKIVCVSHLVRDWVVEAHPHLDPSAIEVVYNRPDLDRFPRVSEEDRQRLREQAGITPDRVVIGTAATNFALKGVRPLIQALARLPEHFELHVAGGRNPQKYQHLARELGVEDRVRFLGKVDDMVAFYGRTDSLSWRPFTTPVPTRRWRRWPAVAGWRPARSTAAPISCRKNGSSRTRRTWKTWPKCCCGCRRRSGPPLCLARGRAVRPGAVRPHGGRGASAKVRPGFPGLSSIDFSESCRSIRLS